jgi:hypothetical protein
MTTTATNNLFRIKNGLEFSDASTQTTAWTGMATNFTATNVIQASQFRASSGANYNTGYSFYTETDQSTGIYSEVEGQVSIYGYENPIATFNTSTVQLYQPLTFGDATVQTTAFTGQNGNGVLQESRYFISTATTSTIVLVTDSGTDANAGIANNMPAYYDSSSTQWLYVYNNIPVTIPNAPSGPPVLGYVGWYNTTSVNLETNSWVDLSDNANHAIITGSPAVVSTTGHGSSAIFDTLRGGPSDRINWPIAILPSNYSLFYLVRIDGTNGCLFSSETGSGNGLWFSGSWGGSTGVAYHSGWVGGQANSYGQNYFIGADQNYFYEANGNPATIGTGGGGSYAQLIMNNPPRQYGQYWEVSEVIVYDRTLDSGEITQTVTYLANKYGITLGV